VTRSATEPEPASTRFPDGSRTCSRTAARPEHHYAPPISSICRRSAEEPEPADLPCFAATAQPVTEKSTARARARDTSSTQQVRSCRNQAACTGTRNPPGSPMRQGSLLKRNQLSRDINSRNLRRFQPSPLPKPRRTRPLAKRRNLYRSQPNQSLRRNLPDRTGLTTRRTRMRKSRQALIFPVESAAGSVGVSRGAGSDATV
jgi:hypothetical protein